MKPPSNLVPGIEPVDEPNTFVCRQGKRATGPHNPKPTHAAVGGAQQNRS